MKLKVRYFQARSTIIIPHQGLSSFFFFHLMILLMARTLRQAYNAVSLIACRSCKDVKLNKLASIDLYLTLTLAIPVGYILHVCV